MSTPTIRSCTSPDADLWSWVPDSAADVYLLVELEIGERGVDGADIFSLLIATPEALRARAADGTSVLLGRGSLVVAQFDWPDIWEKIQALVASCAAETWGETCWKLQRHFCWEYESFQVN